MTATRKEWNPPGWPWELEFIAFCAMAASVFFPVLLRQLGIDHQPALLGAAPSPVNGQNPLAEQHQLVFSFGLVALYLVHLVVAVTTFSHLTTPITHMVTPLIFSGVAFQRISAYLATSSAAPGWFDGSTGNMLLLLVGVFVITVIAARIRMARYLLLFRDEDWDLQSPTVFDASFWEMTTQWRPLFYMPRIYRACSNGILVEGWFYIMPLPFDVFHAVYKVSNVSMSTNGSYYATTSRSLIRIELLDSTMPMFISPKDREAFVEYCTKHIERRKASRGSSPRGTRAGTVSGTHSGTHAGATRPGADASTAASGTAAGQAPV